MKKHLFLLAVAFFFFSTSRADSLILPLCGSNEGIWFCPIISDLNSLRSDEIRPAAIEVSPYLIDSDSYKEYKKREEYYRDFTENYYYFVEDLDRAELLLMTRLLSAGTNPGSGTSILEPVSGKECISLLERDYIGDALSYRYHLCLAIDNLSKALYNLDLALSPYDSVVEKDAEYTDINTALIKLGSEKRFIREDYESRAFRPPFMEWLDYIISKNKHLSERPGLFSKASLISSEEIFLSSSGFREFSELSEHIVSKVSEKEKLCKYRAEDFYYARAVFYEDEPEKINEEIEKYILSLPYSSSPFPDIFSKELEFNEPDCSVDYSYRENFFSEMALSALSALEDVEKNILKISRQEGIYQSYFETLDEENKDMILELGRDSISPDNYRLLFSLSSLDMTLGEKIKKAYFLHKKLSEIKEGRSEEILFISNQKEEQFEKEKEKLSFLLDVACASSMKKFESPYSNITLHGEELSLSVCNSLQKKLEELNSQEEEKLHFWELGLYQEVNKKWEEKVNSERADLSDLYSRLEVLSPEDSTGPELISGWISAPEYFGSMAFIYNKYLSLGESLEDKLSFMEKDFSSALDYTLKCTEEEKPAINKIVPVFCTLNFYNPTYLFTELNQEIALPYQPEEKITNINLVSGNAEISSSGSSLKVSASLSSFTSESLEFEYLSIPVQNKIEHYDLEKENKIYRTYFFDEECQDEYLEIEKPELFYTDAEYEVSDSKLRVKTNCTSFTLIFPYVSFSEEKEDEGIKIALHNLLSEPLIDKKFYFKTSETNFTFPLEHTYENNGIMWTDTIYDEKEYFIGISHPPECGKDYEPPCGDFSYSEIQNLDLIQNATGEIIFSEPEEKYNSFMDKKEAEKSLDNSELLSEFSSIESSLNLLKSVQDKFGVGRVADLERSYQKKLQNFEAEKEIDIEPLLSGVEKELERASSMVYSSLEFEDAPQFLSVPDGIKDIVEKEFGVTYEPVNTTAPEFLSFYEDGEYRDFLSGALLYSKEMSFSNRIEAIKNEAEIALFSSKSDLLSFSGETPPDAEETIILAENSLQAENYYDALYYSLYAGYLLKEAGAGGNPSFSVPVMIMCLTVLLVMLYIYRKKKKPEKSLFGELE